MGAAYFYHLTESTLEETLPMLLEKARQAGWRILVRGTQEEDLRRLDDQLWTRDPDSFLPHGLSGTALDSAHPILLSTDASCEGFNCLMAVSGAAANPSEVALLERCCILFDGLDDRAVAHARTQWKDLTAAEIPAQYWAQENGRWTQKASSG